MKYIVSVLILFVAYICLIDLLPRELTEEEKQWAADRKAYQEYIVYVNEVRENFAKKIFDEMGLVSVGNMSSLHGTAEMIGMKVYAHDRATVDEARALHLIVMEKLVEEINAHEKLRPFLAEYPFTQERVSISLSFNSPFGRYSDGSVAYSHNVSGLEWIADGNKNRLSYDSYDPFNEKFIDILEESYDEAVQRALENPIKNPHIHQTTHMEEAVDEVFEQFVGEMEREYGFQCTAIGGDMDGQVDEIAVNFIAIQRATQDEARALIIATTKKLLNVIDNNEKLKPFLAESPFPIERLKIRIRFRQRNYYPYFDDSMEDVTLESGDINYFQHVKYGPNESFPVKTPISASETYNEAVHKGFVELFTTEPAEINESL